MRSGEQMDGNQVYLTMNGPTEFDVIGRLRDWDRTADLRPDHGADARHLRPLRRDHPGVLRDDHARASRTRACTSSSSSAHCAHLEEPEAYAALVEEFLSA